MATVADQALVDGVAVMVSEVDARTKATLSDVKLPLVVLDGEVKGVRHDSVVIDQRMGVAALLKHLIDNCGAQRLVFVGGQPTNVDTIERLAAFQEAAAEGGVSIESSDVFHLDYRYDTAFDLGQKKVREWARRRVSVFAANDEMAAGIIDAAIDAGLSLPGELPVVGFDDTRIAAMTRPRLTTVHVPMSSMGASAVELLCQRLEDPTRPATKITLQSELIVRESCGVHANPS